jgi:hypothetical protein
MNQADQIREQVLQLRTALDTANPGMATMLRTIHSNLRQDPAIITLLTPEECGTIVAGLMKQTNTIIAASVTKKSATKSLKNTSLDDL